MARVSCVRKGSEYCDEMTPKGFLSNNAGGILGGSLLVNQFSHIAKTNGSIAQDFNLLILKETQSRLEQKGRHDLV